MRGTNSKNEKNKKTRPKKHFFGAVRGWNGAECRDFQKTHLGLLPNVHTKFQLLSSIWRGDGAERALKVKKGEILISPLFTDLRGWDFLLVGLKRDNFCIFDPSAGPPPNWGITEFLPKFIPTHMYLVCHQSEPIDRITVIMDGIRPSK